MAEKNEKEKAVNEQIRDFGQVELEHGEDRIFMLTIIGEIEGHECLPAATKTTKYEHVLPKLAEVEENKNVDGLLLLLNTVGGDVESGLAIAEMVASIDKPTVSLVLGGSHSIGVPLAVSTDYSFIVPSGTMVIHPVRMNGTVIGAQPTYDYFKQMQDRILKFVVQHSKAEQNRLEELMMNTGQSWLEDRRSRKDSLILSVESMRHLQNYTSSYKRQNPAAKKAFNDNQNEIWYT